MAHYLVRARPGDLAALRERLDRGQMRQFEPFGEELQRVLTAARLDEDGFATWEENCFCTPPLAQERVVLDMHFSELTTQRVREGEGWAQINHLPPLWGNH